MEGCLLETWLTAVRVQSTLYLSSWMGTHSFRTSCKFPLIYCLQVELKRESVYQTNEKVEQDSSVWIRSTEGESIAARPLRSAGSEINPVGDPRFRYNILSAKVIHRRPIHPQENQSCRNFFGSGKDPLLSKAQSHQSQVRFQQGDFQGSL